MNELIESFKKGWLDEDPRLVTAILLGIAVFIVLNVLCCRHSKKRNKRKTDAAAKGNVVTAKLRSCYHDRDSKRNTSYSAWYTYTVKGQTKEYHINTDCKSPDTIELYPKNEEMSKFFSDYDRTTNAAIPFNALVAAAVCFFTLWVSGYITF
ncbi:MAG: hypothetical protein E7508_12410 [Ruminococcus sp.]|nr:hypothetical protein [Ruminococcus sp.]